VAVRVSELVNRHENTRHQWRLRAKARAECRGCPLLLGRVLLELAAHQKVVRQYPALYLQHRKHQHEHEEEGKGGREDLQPFRREEIEQLKNLEKAENDGCYEHRMEYARERACRAAQDQGGYFP